MELNRDGDGFLVNTNDWSEEVMRLQKMILRLQKKSKLILKRQDKCITKQVQ